MNKLNFLIASFILVVFAFAGNAHATNGYNDSNSTYNYTDNNNTTLANESNESQNIENKSQSLTMIFYCDMDRDGSTSKESSIFCPSDANSTNCNLTKTPPNSTVINRQNNSITISYKKINITFNITCYVKNDKDCNDYNYSINPGAIDILNNGIDENCNEYDNITCYADLDNDSYINNTNIIYSDNGTCPVNYTNTSTTQDCDDTNSSINPNAAEICNRIDDNCNNKPDEDVCPLLLYYCDKDGDGFISMLPSGNCSTFNCIPLKCQNKSKDDCDDNNASITTIKNMTDTILTYNNTKKNNLMATKIESSKILIDIASLLFYLFVSFAVVVILSWIVFKEKFHH